VFGAALAHRAGEDLPREAEVRGALETGDLLVAIREGVSIAVILEAHCDGAKAAHPSEILDALRSGMTVYGSGPVGGPRAVELAPFGMLDSGAVASAEPQPGWTAALELADARTTLRRVTNQVARVAQYNEQMEGLLLEH
jgi:hypothetical protein